MNPSELLLPIINTLLATALCCLIALPVGGFFAALLSRTNIYGRQLAVLAMTSQLAVPLYVFAGGWAAGVGVQGWMRIDYWLGPTGLGWMQSWLGSWLAVSLIHAAAAIPWVSLILSFGLATCDRNEEEMSLLDGGWRMLWRHVWLPRLRPWIGVAGLWCASTLLTEMVVSNLYMFRSVAELVYLDVSRGTISPLTYWIAGLLCALPIFALGLALSRRLPPLCQVLIKPLQHQSPLFSLGRRRVAVSAAAWIVLLVLVAMPIANLIIKAGWSPIVNGSAQGHTWTVVRFTQTIVESLTLFRSEFYWSVMLAGLSCALVVLLASGLYSVSSERSRLRAICPRWAMHGMMLLMIATPGAMIGLAISHVMNRPGWLGQLYYTTLAAPAIAQQFRLLPLAWLMLCALLASVPSRTWQMAQADGLSNWGTFRAVVLKPSWPVILAGILLLALLSIGELSCSMGVLPPGVTTISMRLFEILHFGMRHQDSGLCGLLMLLAWSAAAVIQFARHYRKLSSD